MNYRPVIGEGMVEFIKNDSKKRDAFNIIMNQYSESINWEFGHKMGKTLVFKVEIEKISVKKSS